MKILHLADIHIRGLTRHKEYRNAFQDFFAKATEIAPDIIFVGGDIWHTKCSNITPEAIELMTWMFRGMANIADTHIILGNHDGNLFNCDRQDVISPIIEAINHPNLHLYKKSGVYSFESSMTEEQWDYDYPENNPNELLGCDVNLCVFSCFDKDNWNKVKPENDKINIAAYHGSIAGCVVDTDWVMKEGEETVSFFDGYDFALLGDIHKRQFLSLRPDKNDDEKPWIAYPGSTIQQNFGEDETKGFLVWDIRAKDDWDVEFVEIENKQPYATIPWMGSVKETILNIEKERGDRAFLEGARFRTTSSQSIPLVETRQLHYQLKAIHKAEESIIKDDTITNLATISTKNINIQKTSLRNDIETLMKLYKEYVSGNAPKHTLTEQQLEQAKDVVASYINKINIQETDQARDVAWSIKGLEFNNTFKYGEDNSIDFDKFNGIVGIFGPNKTGKSSIPGTLMYGLFNTTDRGPMKAAHIINKNKKSCSAKVRISVGGNDYFINRETKRAEAKRASTIVDEEKTFTSLLVGRVQNDGSTIDIMKENGDSRTDTDKVIRALIGNAQDFLLTAFSNQGGINKFIEQGATERKTILNRLLDLDIFEKMYKYANEDVASINAKTHRFPRESWDKLIDDAKKEIEIKDDQIRGMAEEIQLKKNEADSLRFWIMQHQNNVANIDVDALKNIEKTIQKLNLETEKNIKEQHVIKAEISRLEKIISNTEKLVSSIDIVALRQKSEQVILTTEKMRELSVNYREQNTLLQVQEKSVKKLAMVPCGDQFPECHFIKDSHQDKAIIEEQRKLVQQIVEQLTTVEEEVRIFQQERLSDKIKEFEKAMRDLETGKTETKHKIEKLNVVDMTYKQLSARLKISKEQEEELLGKVNLLESEEFEQKKLRLNGMEYDLEILEKKKNNLLVQLGVSKNSLDRLFEDKKECEILIKELKLYESIAAAFSKNGIPAMVLKTQLPAINLELAKILSGVVSFKITLETDTTSNIMDVFIEDDHSRRIIELASGMEKLVASLAIRVALVNLSSLPKSDMFIIDEGFGVLDEENIPKVLELLVSLKAYFKTILVISHVPAIKEIADYILEIQNDGTESKIVA